MAERNREYERLIVGGQSASQTSFTDQKQHGSNNAETEAVEEGTSNEKDKQNFDQDRDQPDEETKMPKKRSCPMDYWGVRSYLHNFYDTHVVKDPEVYEECEDDRYLLANNTRGKKCKAIWWKIFVWIGANLLLFGIIGVLVGYMLPPRPTLTIPDERIAVVDNDAVQFNFNLDLLKLIGLILFCTGGIILTIALIFPSFLANMCEEERQIDGAFKVSLLSEKKPVKHTSGKSIPVTSKISNVQPERKSEELALTMDELYTDSQ